MKVFRLCKAHWQSVAFSGQGSIRFPGKWHFAGVPLVYTATSGALAALEMLVHMDLRHAPDDLVLINAEVPNNLISEAHNIPVGWDYVPANHISREIGTQWQRNNRSVALRVPSVIMPSEDNVLLNPQHSDFAQVTIGNAELFTFDPRLRG